MFYEFFLCCVNTSLGGARAAICAQRASLLSVIADRHKIRYYQPAFVPPFTKTVLTVGTSPRKLILLYLLCQLLLGMELHVACWKRVIGLASDNVVGWMSQ